jgi:hypothetical protein
MNPGTVKGCPVASDELTPGDLIPRDLTRDDLIAILGIEPGANRYVHPNHTGQVFTDGNGDLKIKQGAIENNNLAKCQPLTIKGNAGGSVDFPEDIPIGKVLALLGIGIYQIVSGITIPPAEITR